MIVFAVIARPVVTFRKEGVDWNSVQSTPSSAKSPVTFRKEGVDWNCQFVKIKVSCFASPSVRKVWIEISKSEYIARVGKSPSVRKVWIEIYASMCQELHVDVTFRKEGVDWNQMKNLFQSKVKSHLP